MLGRLLSDKLSNQSNLDAALRVYDTVRRPIGNFVVEHTRTAGLTYEFNHVPETVRAAGVEMGSPKGLELLSDFINDAWSFHWRSMPEDDWLRAEKMLHTMISGSEMPARY